MFIRWLIDSRVAGSPRVLKPIASRRISLVGHGRWVDNSAALAPSKLTAVASAGIPQAADQQFRVDPAGGEPLRRGVFHPDRDRQATQLPVLRGQRPLRGQDGVGQPAGPLRIPAVRGGRDLRRRLSELLLQITPVAVHTRPDRRLHTGHQHPDRLAALPHQTRQLRGSGLRQQRPRLRHTIQGGLRHHTRVPAARQLRLHHRGQTDRIHRRRLRHLHRPRHRPLRCHARQ